MQFVITGSAVNNNSNHKLQTLQYCFSWSIQCLLKLPLFFPWNIIICLVSLEIVPYINACRNSSLPSPHRILCWHLWPLYSTLDSCPPHLPKRALPGTSVPALLDYIAFFWLSLSFLYLLVFWNMSSINFLRKGAQQIKFKDL